MLELCESVDLSTPKRRKTMEINMTKLMTVGEVCDFFQCSETKFYDDISPYLARIKMGRMVRFNPVDIIEYMKNYTLQPEREASWQFTSEKDQSITSLISSTKRIGFEEAVAQTTTH